MLIFELPTKAFSFENNHMLNQLYAFKIKNQKRLFEVQGVSQSFLTQVIDLTSYKMNIFKNFLKESLSKILWGRLVKPF